MSKKIYLLFVLFVLFSWLQVAADDFINITPKPKSVTVGKGEVKLPDSFEIGTIGLTDEMTAEVEKFATGFRFVTEKSISVKSDTAGCLVKVCVATLTSLGSEGYKISVTTDGGVLLQARTAAGLFYAFQSLKKLLPLNVMAGVKDAAADYRLPVVEITDAPRFDYRGFMLDVCRHFFTTDEVKRMLDVMSYYKMNRFHWHLSDDQGWRVEIKKWPKLIEVGSVRSTSYNVDPVYGRYNQYAPYGPYFYTQEEIKEVVEYARQLHIDIIPEVDMPGHFCAALAAYPQFSCTPGGSHSVQTDGGIYSDVMNVANDAAIEFTKDILDELTELFPYPYLHIGGDECPTSAWEQNSECRALYAAEGYTSYRQLQSRFIKILADYVAGKEDAAKRRKLMVWNEAISAGGSDTELMKEAGVTVMCWNPCDASALKAAKLGLNSVVTPYGPYYINRKQSTDAGEPVGAGDGADNLERTYAYQPIPTANRTYSDYYQGVQGTFWTEHVSSDYLLEYLALPRLMAVAETGWSLENRKNFEDFCQRITADSTLLNYGGYAYGRHYMKIAGGTEMVMPNTSADGKWNWYRIVTRNTGDANRTGKCIELLHEGADNYPSSATAAVNRLWSATPVEEGNASYDYQLWAVRENPEAAGRYALVCKAKPDGSVNPTATAQSTSGRWDYDDDGLHYDFVLGDKVYTTNGDNYCYSIRSSKSSAGLYMNMAAGGQSYSINQYNNPSDGNSGIWEFRPIGQAAQNDSLPALLGEAVALLNHITTYSSADGARPGQYSKAMADALQSAVSAAVGYETLTESERVLLTASLCTAMDNLKSSLTYPAEGVLYRITNTHANFKGVALCDNGKGNLMTSDERWANNAWKIKAVTRSAEKQQLKLQNAITGRWVTGTASPLTLSASAGASYDNVFAAEFGDFTLSAGANALFPISKEYSVNGGCVYTGGVRPQGTGWRMEPVVLLTYCCIDEQNEVLNIFTESAVTGEPYELLPPEIPNYRVQATDSSFVPVKDDTLFLHYTRSSYAVTLRCADEHGVPLLTTTQSVPVGDSFTLSYPAIPYYDFVQSDWTGEVSFVPTEDAIVNIVYSTTALLGFKSVGEPVTSVTQGGFYLLYDATDASGRSGFLNVGLDNSIIYTTNGISSGSPLYVWQLQKSGSAYTVKNGGGKYMPAISSGSNVSASASAGKFTFSLNGDGETWSVKCSNGLYWNGNAGSFTGWSNAHPYRLYSLVAAPYYSITVLCQDGDGKSLGEDFDYVEAGGAYSLSLPAFDGYEVKSVAGDTAALASVGDFLTFTVSYDKIDTAVETVVRESISNRGDVVYDVNGRRVTGMERDGIYIVNGKKIWR